MLDQLVGSPMSLHGDLSCVAYFFSRWPPKAERVDLRPSFSETEKKPATFAPSDSVVGFRPEMNEFLVERVAEAYTGLSSVLVHNELEGGPHKR